MRGWFSTKDGLKILDISTELVFIYDAKKHKKLSTAKLLGDGATIDKFEWHFLPFGGEAAVRNKKQTGEYFFGQLYEIDRGILCRYLDLSKQHFKRQRTKFVRTSDEQIFDCWIYLYKFPNVARFWSFMTILSS